MVGAEWDDAGYWAPGSVRNLVYYMASGFAVPLLLGVVFWGQRDDKSSPAIAAACPRRSAPDNGQSLSLT